MAGGAGRLGRLIYKELAEILRDRRTIVTLVLMPLLLYPLLSVAFQQFFLANRLVPSEEAEYRLGFVSEDEAAHVVNRLDYGERVLLVRAEAMKESGPARPRPKRTLVVGPADKLELALKAGELDVVVRALPVAEPGAPPPPRGPIVDLEVVYLPGSPGALGALAYLETRLAAANEMDLAQRVRLPKARPVLLLRLHRAPIAAPAGADSLISLASLVPLILILMTITGAVYPAIDLTAGERERGTLEILVAAPVPRLGLLFAKYVSVWTVAVLTALVNLTAMMLTLALSGLGAALFDRGLSAELIVQLFALLLLFAAFFSAVLLCITSFARSFKEAQAYLIPLMLVSLAPGVMGMTPGLELESWAVTPLLNIVLLGRDLIEGNAEPAASALVVISTLIYALAAIAVAARVFGAESVLYSEQSSWSDLFRRPETPQRAASLSAALWCLASMIPTNFVLQGVAVMLVRAGYLTTYEQLWFGVLRAAILFGAVPFLFAWSGRLLPGPAFGLRRARPAALGGALVLGASLWPLVFWIMLYVGLKMPDEVRQRYQDIAAVFRTLSPPVKIALVVIPALLEEWFFRGYLYGALRTRLRPLTVVVLTTLAFSAAHWMFSLELGRYRLLPSALMGLALGGVRAASGSVVPGMLLHACHNAVLVMLPSDPSLAPEEIADWWVWTGAAASLMGAGLLWLGHRREPADPSDRPSGSLGEPPGLSRRDKTAGSLDTGVQI